MKKILRIGLDIDDVLFDWAKSFSSEYHCPVQTKWNNPYVTSERLEELSHNKEFWLKLPLKNFPDFMPVGFVSARSIPLKWTRELLQRYKIPGRSNISQVRWNTSKLPILQELKLDVFVDDKLETFAECWNNDIFCLLMDAPHNQCSDTPYRIHTLKYTEIYSLWHQYQLSQSL